MAGVLTTSGVLIQMKVRMIAHSMNGTRASGMILGGLAGLVLAAGTIILAGSGVVAPALRADLTAAVFAVWLFGWLLGPIYTGGGDESLRPEQFALVPWHPAKLAIGLLCTAFAGVPPLISLVAFSALAVHAAGFGLAALAVSIPAVVLQLVLVIVLSRLMIALLGRAIRSRASAILAALVNSFMNAVLNQSWVLIWAAIELDLLNQGLPPAVSTVVRALPSGWGLVAVEAAGRGAWPLVAAALAGLLVLIAVALLGWSRMLVRRTTSRPLRPARPLASPLPAEGTVSAVAAKELLTWSRDLMRTHLLYFSIFFGVLYTAAPLIIGWPGMLPYAGTLVVVMAAATSANLFGLDGTSLWLSLVHPGVERDEVRGRQIAWLIKVAPVAIVLTVAGLVLGGEAWTWPWALALLAATLGGGAGLIVLVSVYLLVPVPEPSKRGGNPLEAGNIFGLVLLMLLLTPVTALPAVGVAVLGQALGLPVVLWAAVPVGGVTGALLAGWFGRLAYRRLRAQGPELLSRMRGGAGEPGVRPAYGQRVKLPPRTNALVTFLWIFCWIPLFPQGLVPLYMIFTDSPSKLWFLALHVPSPYQIPIAVAMSVLGFAMLYFGTVIPRRYERLQGTRDQASGNGADADRGARPHTHA
ncbi:hypothetical protein [Microbispora sp. NPDC049125]|uniref:hypothetical protein n=1 Tax=Microbispora sp. NPDC049125 TaxID=3154929 RepID=UPI00346594B2